MQNVIIKPIITEKSMQDTGLGKYSFEVHRFATKTEVKKAIKDAFGVHVVSVATVVVKGRRQKVGKRRIEVKSAATKKATVFLKKGDKISIFESGTDEKESKKK